MRLPPATHGNGDNGFISTAIGFAREKGAAAYVGDGANRWPAVHRDDAARIVFASAIISYLQAYELVRSHGESGVTARLMPFTVDGSIWAASMAVVLDASRRNQPMPRLAAWSLGVGIVATVGTQPGAWRRARPGWCPGRAWPALALVGRMGAVDGRGGE